MAADAATIERRDAADVRSTPDPVAVSDIVDWPPDVTLQPDMSPQMREAISAPLAASTLSDPTVAAAPLQPTAVQPNVSDDAMPNDPQSISLPNDAGSHRVRVSGHAETMAEEQTDELATATLKPREGRLPMETPIRENVATHEQVVPPHQITQTDLVESTSQAPSSPVPAAISGETQDLATATKATPPDTSSVRPENQAPRLPNQSPRIAPAVPRAPVVEPGLLISVDALAPPNQPIDATEQQDSYLATPDIAIQHPSLSQSRPVGQESPTPAVDQRLDGQPVAPRPEAMNTDSPPSAATPAAVVRPAVAPRQRESVDGAITEVRSRPLSETAASEPPISRPSPETLSADAQTVGVQPLIEQSFGTMHAASRLEWTDAGQMPDDLSPSANNQPTVEPTARNSSALASTVSPPESASDNVPFNDTLPRDQVEMIRQFVSAVSDGQSRQPAQAVSNQMSEPLAAPIDGPTSSLHVPGIFATPDATIRTDGPDGGALPPESALPPIRVDFDNRPSSPRPNPHSLDDLPAPHQPLPPKPIPDALRSPIAFSSQQIPRESTESERQGIIVPVPLPDSTVPSLSAARPNHEPASASDGRPPSGLIQSTRQQPQPPVQPVAAETPNKDAFIAPESITPQIRDNEPTTTVTPVSQTGTDNAAPVLPMNHVQTDAGIAHTSSGEQLAMAQPVPAPATEPSAQINHVDFAAPLISPSQAATEMSTPIPDPVRPEFQPTATLGSVPEAPLESVIGTPMTQSPDPLSQTVAQPTQEGTAHGEPTERSLPIFNEVRQARRRPILAAPPPPVETPAEPEMDSAERQRKLDQVARLKRFYFGDTVDETETVQPIPELAVTTAASETPVGAIPAPPNAPLPVAPIPARVVEHGTAPTPITLPDATHRFLRPLVGFDPRTVPIYRDSATNRLTAGHNADAVTDGRAVVVATTNVATERPETLGLLAHEFTHVARRQRPRFIPPIVRTSIQESRDPRVIGERGGERAASLTEESLAEQVEERVIRAARAAPFFSPQFSPSPPHRSETDPAHQQSARETVAFHAVSPDKDWGDLPAPWEAVPDWMQQSPADTGAGGSGIHGQTAPVGASAPVVQRAGNERSLPGQHEDNQSAFGPADEGGYGAEPNLDALARQVYAILKNRLAVERRRTG